MAQRSVIGLVKPSAFKLCGDYNELGISVQNISNRPGAHDVHGYWTEKANYALKSNPNHKGSKQILRQGPLWPNLSDRHGLEIQEQLATESSV
jgi:hypothetical protein